MAFWDSSAVLGLCVHRKSTAALKRLLRKDPHLAVWWGTPVEVASALARLASEGLLSAKDLSQAERLLGVLRRSFTEILPRDGLRDLAAALAKTKNTLSSVQAFELAAAMVWCGEHPNHNPFVCDDVLLAAAAEWIGFSVQIAGPPLKR